MDSVDSLSVILPVKGKVQESRTVIYQFYIGDKDDAFPEKPFQGNSLCANRRAPYPSRVSVFSLP